MHLFRGLIAVQVGKAAKADGFAGGGQGVAGRPPVAHHVSKGVGIAVVLGESQAHVDVCSLWSHRVQDQGGHSRGY